MRACDYSVFRIDYKTITSERRSICGGMDSELTGRTLINERQYLVVAPTMEFAMTVFNRYHGKDEFLTIQLVGQLNDIVLLQ